MNQKDNRTLYHDPDHLCQGLLNSDFIFDPGGKGLDGAAYTLRSWRDDFYCWQSGYWKRLTDAEIKRTITEYIQRLNEDELYNDNGQITCTTQRINNIKLNLTGRVGTPERVELTNSWKDGRDKLYQTIAVNNGLLLLRKNNNEPPELVEHTPDFFGLAKLPFNYNPDAKCPQWLAFLDDVMQGDKEFISLLQQWVGYLFNPELRLQKFLLCCGEGANGKTVLFDVIAALIGKENVSEVPLCRFGYPFSLYYTLGKLVNMSHESSSLIEDEAETTLKSYVSGDTLQFERKFREPVFTAPTARVMVATNALPRFNDKTRAIWRRILLVPFEKVIPDDVQVVDFAEKLKTELPGILNWGLEGLKKLNEHGRFKEPERSRELLEEYRRDSDPARAFLLENYLYSPNGYGVSCRELYESYKGYCLDGGYKPMADRTFGKQVRRAFKDVERRRQGDRDNREWFYSGLVSIGAEETAENVPF